MTTGIQANGVDLDAIFLPRETTKRADVNWQSNGNVDISNRFQEYTSGTKAAVTNLQSGGSDLKDLFQNISVPLEAVTWTTTLTESTAATPRVLTGVKWLTTGITQQTTNAGAWATSASEWGTPEGSVTGANFEMNRGTVTGDALDTNTVAASPSWTNLGTAQEMSYAGGAGSDRSCTVNVTIRKVGDAGSAVTCALTISQNQA